jgi:tetratricopeptide (TPR) repeat protein
MTGNQERFQTAINQGHNAAWEQAWEEAAAFYRQALEEIPDHPQALNSLGLAYLELNNDREAMQCYQRAARAAPGDPLPVEKVGQLAERLANPALATEAYFRAAELYAKNRDLNKAIENWQHATEITPGHILAHSRLALVYERTDRKAQAVSEYLIVAALLQKQKDLSKAVQVLTRSLELMPQSREVMKAMNLLKAGQQLPLPVQARSSSPTPAAQKAPKMLQAPEAPVEDDQPDPIQEARALSLSILAALLFEQDDEEPASGPSVRRGLDSILRGQPAGETKNFDHTRIILHLTQMVDYQAKEKFPEAIEELERAILAGLEHPAAHFNLGYLLVETGSLDRAQQHLLKAVPNPDFALGSQLLLGQVYKSAGELRLASVAHLEALRLADGQVVEPRQAEELQQLYDPLLEEHEQNSDEKAQEEIIANVRDLLLRRGWRRHLIQARQQLPSVEEDMPPVPLAEILTETRGSRLVEAVGRVHQYARMGYLRSAIDEAYQALQFAPTYLPLHAYIGELLIQQDRTQTAIDKFSVVARSYSTRGDSRRSLSMYRRILDLSPMNLDARNKLIDMLTGLGQMDDALNEYCKLADVYYGLADMDMARETYNQALVLTRQPSVHPTWKARLLHHIAELDLQSLDWRQALRVYEQIRGLQPDDARARRSLVDLNFRLSQSPKALAELDNYVSYLWSNGLKKEAIGFTEDLLEENDRQPHLRRRLAELYRQVGRGADAVGQLDVAAELLVEAGDRAGAVEAIRTIISLNPPNARDYQKLLAELMGS